MADGITSGEPGIDRVPERTERPGFITCAGCESTLHKNGELKKKSDALKDLEKTSDQLAVWKNRAEEAERKLNELRTQETPAPAPPTPEPSPQPAPTPGRARFPLR